MVANDVEVAVVDEGLVAGVEDELDVVHLRLHEHVDHGEVHVARVGERHLTNMEGFPRNRNKMAKILLHIKNFIIPSGCKVAEVFIVVLGRIKVADGNVVVVAAEQNVSQLFI